VSLSPDGATAPASGSAIAVGWRDPARIVLRAPLARAMLAPKAPRPLARLRRKMVRALFHMLHQQVGLPAPAILRLGNGTTIEVGCANTAFLGFADAVRQGDGVEPEVSALLIAAAPQLEAVYDIGANWGYYPLLLGGEPRFGGVVHAFEMAPRTIADLRHVIGAAGLSSRVIVHGFGLSDREGEALATRERHSYLARVVGREYRGAVDRVRLRRLDDLDLPPPSLVKIDVEGHEMAVLRGGRRTFERHQPLVVIESRYEPMRADAMLAPLRLLTDMGYRLHRLAWQRSAAAASAPGSHQGELRVTPLAVADRAAIAEPLNLLAVPARRDGDIAALVRAR
jgi:FkbM family methyltransferase